MTASTQSNEDSGTPEKKQKVKKPKGPIRVEAIGTILIIATLFGLYGKFFFDSHLKKGMEWTATYIHGAEVNIKNIKTSVFGGSFKLSGLQVTDKKNPQNNMVKIGQMNFGFLWDALLRAKFVVSEASILDIEIQSPRKKPGYIVPQEEYKKESKALSKLEESVLEQSKEELQGNALGDVAEVLGGADPKDQIKSIQGELKAEKKIQELETGLKDKEEEWKKRIDGLDHKEQLDRVTAKAKSIKFDKKKPWKSLKEYKAVAKEAKSVFNEYKSLSSDLKNDVKTYSSAMNNIDDLIKEDMSDLQNRFKIPSLDFQDFSKALFGRLFQEKVKDIYKYLEIAKEYMPPKKTEKKEGLVPKKRGEGKNYKFTVKNGYPLFWMKEGRISSKSGASEFSGDLDGKIIDVTSDPVFLGRPAVITLKGNFPKQKISGVDAKAILDHTKDIPVQTLSARVDSFPVAGRTLSKSEKVKFAIKDARAAAKLNAEVKGKEVNINLVNTFKSVAYEVDAKNKVVKETLTNVVNGIPRFQVKARASGTWEKLNWGISSSLGKQLADGVKGQVKAKVDEAKDKARKLIDDKIGPKKAELTKKFDDLKNKMSNLLKSKEDEVTSAKDSAVSSAAGGQKAATPRGAVKQKAKEKVKDLFKKFKF
ncbi:MAG: hypothetical protein CME70_04205 [Halobacteriovorax sp.]|nr:hypothetical protein [Halobacteriovorax sp.]|tara:strand:+ start:69763 stop:71706 length:1944 start_codon:yes stop_codon:yes gene_type:complete